MEKDQIILLKDRSIISISGEDTKDFLQNLITNDIKKVSETYTIFSGLFTPQGKYLFEFFLIQSKDGFFIDCHNKFTQELINCLTKYKLKSKIEIKDLSSEYTVNILSLKKFDEMQYNKNENANTIKFEGNILFIDPRKEDLGARLVTPLRKLHFLIKKLKLKIIEPEIYYTKAYSLGIPIKKIESLKEQLFGLEANFNDLKAIDFKKGCYVGQENTARMNLKNKVRKKLKAVKVDFEIKIGDEIKCNNLVVGKILIGNPYPFALIKIFDPEISSFKDKKLKINNKIIEIIA
jgi:folate-binding protein YgfZ